MPAPSAHWSMQATAAAQRRCLLLLRPRPVRPLRFLALLALYLSVGSLLLSHSAPLVARLAARAGVAAGSGGGVGVGGVGGGGGGGVGGGGGHVVVSTDVLEEPSGAPLEGTLQQLQQQQQQLQQQQQQQLQQQQGAALGVGMWASRGSVSEGTHRDARYVGCFADDPKQRTLQGLVLYDYRKMTLFRCHDNCADRGYRYAGLEFGAECYCGHRVQGRNVSEEECKMECKGGAQLGVRGGQPPLHLPPGARARPEGAPPPPPRYCVLPRAVSLRSAAQLKEVVRQRPLKKEIDKRVITGGAFFALRRCAKKRLVGSMPTLTPAVYLGFACLSLSPPWSHKRCVEKRFLPARGRRLTALASFPGAGNTWTRHLLELATGYYTGSFYFDGSLYNKGFKGEKDHWRSGRTLCVKTHESGRREIEAFDAAILLVRNPYRALVAEFNRKYGGHLGYASEKRWRGKEWPDFVHSYAPWWVSHALDWLRYGPRRRLLVVHYERLRGELHAEMRRMVAFLASAALLLEERLLCTEAHRDGSFKRSGRRKLAWDPFTAPMRAAIDGYIRVVNDALLSGGHGPLPSEYCCPPR
ncbi:unnamed protein product [Lampetra planeri]